MDELVAPRIMEAQTDEEWERSSPHTKANVQAHAQGI